MYIKVHIPEHFRERAFPTDSDENERPRVPGSSDAPWLTDPNVVTIRFLRDSMGTGNMELIPEDVLELIIQELAQDLGLFPLNEFPNQEEVCERLVLFVDARQHGMRSRIFRVSVGRFSQDAGVSHSPLTDRSDTGFTGTVITVPENPEWTLK